jgi:signal transduction histidine kinase
VRLTLRYKLLLYSVVLAVVPLGLAGTRMIRITQDELKSSANEEISVTAEQTAREIDRIYADTWLAPMELVASGVDTESLSAEAKLALLQAGIRNIADVASSQLSVEGFAQPLTVTSNEVAKRLDGAGLDSVETLTVPVALLRQVWGSGERVFFGDLRYLEAADLWLMTMVIALEHPIAGRRAAVTAKVNLDRLRDTVRDNPFQNTGSMILVGPDGRELFDPQRRDLRDREIVALASDMLTTDTRVLSVHPYQRSSGERMLGGFAFPRHLDLAVVVERTEEDAYLAVAGMEQSLTLWVLAGLAVAAAGGLIGALQISRPVENIDAVARKVGEGNFDVRAAESRSGDEIADLARQINRMIEGLVERERVKGENVQLRELNEQKNRLLGMAAHDLRNPIGVIAGCSEMILEEEDLDDELRTLTAKIETTSKFMLRLLNDLLDLSQIESGKLELHLSSTDMDHLIRQNVELNRIIAGKKSIRVEYMCADKLPELLIDPAKVEQVLNNLISNAIKFSFPDTVVRVAAKLHQHELSIAVADEGQGIPPHEVQKVFTAFEKTSVRSTAGEKSTGLGLSIVKKIVEGHGGTIGVESEVGKGSTFYLSLPLEHAPPEREPGDRRGQRVAAGLRVQFSVEHSATGSRAGSGTALDLSSTGMQLETEVPLRIGDTIGFAIELPHGAIMGVGDLVRRISNNRCGIEFSLFEGQGEQRLRRYLESDPESLSV